MKTKLVSLLGLVLVLSILSGCSVERRYITHTVSAKDTLYTAHNSAPAAAPAPEAPAPEAPAAMDDAPATTAEGEAPVAAEAAPVPVPVPRPAATPAPKTNWMYIAYAEVTETNLLIMKTIKTKSKILRCLIEDNNSVTCTEQAEASALLNPADGK